MIDIDLLVKLIKLANNNPNDNEANLAARKACKMLLNEKGDFVFRVKTSPVHGPTIKPSDYKSPSNPVKQDYKKTYYNEPKPRPDYWSDPFTVDDELIKEFFRYKDRGGRGPIFEEAFRNRPFRDEKPSKYDRDNQRELTCIVCRQEVETGFVGPPGAFVCTPCQWKK